MRPEAGLRGSDQPLMRRYDAALLDLDGVVYVGSRPVNTARQALAGARAEGLRLAYLTNNASRTPSAIAAQLRDLGIPAQAGDVITSAHAAARMVAERVPPRSPVLVAGGTGLRQAVHLHGLRPVSTAAEHPVAVVQGYAPNLSYDLLAEAVRAVSRGVLYVAANADVTLPTAAGPAPGNGALVQVVRAATGSDPIYAGKPETPLYREALLRSGAERPVMVGDRLETDIEGARRAGMDSLLVLTGVADPLDLALAPPPRRPTYVAADLGGLLAAHPGVRREGDAWRCRGWTARWHGDRFEVAGQGDPCDGLRALCRAAWAGGGPVDRTAVAGALANLTSPTGP